MRALTLILPHFKNLGMLVEHQRIFASYPEDLRAQLHVIVVDDGSPKGYRPSQKMLTTSGLASQRIYRILDHIPWDWLSCRNRGVAEATTDWVLLTDIDHALPVETLRWLLTATLDVAAVYRLSRVDAPRRWPYRLAECPPYKMHPNTWLLTRAMYDLVGGYDERLSGCYGTDGEFRDRIYGKARAVITVDPVLIRYPREIIPDASTVGYLRKNNPANDEELRLRREARALIPGWKPIRGAARFEHVATVGDPHQVEALC